VTSIQGNLQFEGNTQLASIDVSNLKSASGSIGVSGGQLQEVVFTALETVGGDLSFESNEGLQKVDLSNVTSIKGNLHFQGNDQLSSIDVSKLESADGGIGIAGGQLREVNH